jgi:hypothetical protein
LSDLGVVYYCTIIDSLLVSIYDQFLSRECLCINNSTHSVLVVVIQGFFHLFLIYLSDLTSYSM